MSESQFKIRGWAIEIHERMVSEATVNDDGKIIWSGSVAKVFRELKVNQGYHTPIMRLLQQTDCLRQVQRGSRNVPSVYVILRSPGMLSESDWPSVSSIVKSRPGGLTTEQAGYRLLEQEIKNLSARLPEGLNVGQALAEFNSELSQLKQEVQLLKEQINNKES